MRAGKNVLVEKAFTANENQAKVVMTVSEQLGLYCAEAIWTRYLPSRRLIDEVIASGEIGDVRVVHAELSYSMGGKERLVKPELAGGALLDVGVYPLNFVSMVSGNTDIERINTGATLSELGVDESSFTTFWFDNGIIASISSSYVCAGDREGVIQGDKGYIVVTNINNPEAIDVYDTSNTKIRSMWALSLLVS